MSTGGPCEEQLAIEEERISEKYAQEEAEALGNLSKNAVVNLFGDCSKGIATATFPHQAAENLRKKSKKSRRREDEALVNESPRYLPPFFWCSGLLFQSSNCQEELQQKQRERDLRKKRIQKKREAGKGEEGEGAEFPWFIMGYWVILSLLFCPNRALLTKSFFF